MSSRLPPFGGAPGPAATTYGFEIDPRAVLGVSAFATLEEVRDAYRAKAKKHHPDHGGDAWAFQIVSRSYEILSSARVMGHVTREAGAPAANPAVPPQSPRFGQRPDPETPRRGVSDAGIPADRMVDIEVFLVRYELRHPTDLIFQKPSDRSLCCCLNISWTAPPEGGTDSEAEAIPRELDVHLKFLSKQTRALASWANVQDSNFDGWVSYSDASHAWDAFEKLHTRLNDAGLGVRQTTREMVLPRTAP